MTAGVRHGGQMASDAQRLIRLRNTVLTAAHTEAVSSARCVLLSGVATAGASVLAFCGILFANDSPIAASGFCFGTYVVLVLNFAFNPGRNGLIHAEQEGRLREFERALDDIQSPVDSRVIGLYERHASALIACRESCSATRF